MFFFVVFYFPRSILATSFWIPSERTLIMWCSYVKAKRSPPITLGISWATWLRVRVTFLHFYIFYCTNLITQLITGSRRSYRRCFGQYQAFIRQKGRRENKPSEIGCTWCQGGVGGPCAFFASVLAIATSAYYCLGAWYRLEIFKSILKRESAKQNKKNTFDINRC